MVFGRYPTWKQDCIGYSTGLQKFHEDQNISTMDRGDVAEGEEREHEITKEEINRIEKYITDNSKYLYKYPDGWNTWSLMQRLAFILASIFVSNLFEESDNEAHSMYINLTGDTNIYDLILSIDEFAFNEVCNLMNTETRELIYSSYKASLFPKLTSELFNFLQSNKKDLVPSRLYSWLSREIKDCYNSDGSIESKTSYKGIELKSPGHLKICKRLEDDGVMFFFEAPTFLLGDRKSKRYVDLVVIKNNRAVIVEIDGWTYHRSRTQQEDDNERDRLIRKNWNNTLRLSHDEAMNRTNEAIQKIYDAVDPTRGSIS